MIQDTLAPLAQLSPISCEQAWFLEGMPKMIKAKTLSMPSVNCAKSWYFLNIVMYNGMIPVIGVEENLLGYYKRNWVNESYG